MTSEAGVPLQRIVVARLLAVGAVVEALTGIALIVVPAVVVRLLFSGNVSPAGAATGQVAGFALLSLGWACWPRRGMVESAPFQALVAYNVLAALFFWHVGIGGALVGTLLWVAAAFHTAMAVFLICAWLLSDRVDSLDRVNRRR